MCIGICTNGCNLIHRELLKDVKSPLRKFSHLKCRFGGSPEPSDWVDLSFYVTSFLTKHQRFHRWTSLYFEACNQSCFE